MSARHQQDRICIANQLLEAEMEREEMAAEMNSWYDYEDPSKDEGNLVWNNLSEELSDRDDLDRYDYGDDTADDYSPFKEY